jgi:hypothetical protein
MRDIFRDDDEIGYYNDNDYNSKRINYTNRAINPKAFNNY